MIPVSSLGLEIIPTETLFVLLLVVAQLLLVLVSVSILTY